MRALLTAPALALALAGYSPLTIAQTTAGTSATIVVPVIAQTASFSSEVTAYNPNAGAISVDVAFYDANNTDSPGLKTCTPLALPAGRSAQFVVSTQCALPVGGNFGLLILSESTGTQRFYGYARTQTPQGVGFSTEGFPIENFNDQLQHATGLKRTAASGSVPAFQSNCFVATLGDAVDYELRLFNGGTGAQLGGTLSGTLGAFQQFRYLDVFAAAGVAAGDKTNVRAQFTNLTGAEKKLIGFCTVQENTSFGADFRIAKSYGVPGTISGLTQGAGITLTPSPITTTGGIAADTTYLQRRVSATCSAGSSIRAIAADGTVTCQTDTSGTGTVTSVETGSGLAGGPITTSGTINLATTQLLPTSSCTTNQIPKWNGSAWTCGNDNNGGGTLTSITAGEGLTGGTITTSGTLAVNPSSSTLTGTFFMQGGNNFGPTTAVLGNLDFQQPLEIWAAGLRAMRFEYTELSPNIVGGFAGNTSNALLSGGQTTAGGGQTIAGGGYPGSCSNFFGFVAPSSCANQTFSDFASIGGGFGNSALGYGTTVAGGSNNFAGLIQPYGNATYDTVSGGYFNAAIGAYSTISGGSSNGTTGAYSVIPGGTQNFASGTASFAAGYNAFAVSDGEFVWADDINAVFDPTVALHGWGSRVGAANTFNARATGGVWFVSGLDGSNQPSTYVYLNHGSGAWSGVSDRAVKENFRAIDAQQVLTKVAAMPIESWNYIAEGEQVRHLGPVSQDFWAAFGLGTNDKTITNIDESGVALAAIQGLHRLVQEKDAAIAALSAKSEAQERQLVEQQRAISELRERVSAAENLRGELAAVKAALIEIRRSREIRAAR